VAARGEGRTVSRAELWKTPRVPAGPTDETVGGEKTRAPASMPAALGCPLVIPDNEVRQHWFRPRPIIAPGGGSSPYSCFCLGNCRRRPGWMGTFQD
jgi:hypothetical protein